MEKMIETLIKEGKIKIKYEGIIEIYPRKFTNEFAFNAFLVKLKLEGYEFIKITNNWLRAMK